MLSKEELNHPVIQEAYGKFNDELVAIGVVGCDECNKIIEIYNKTLTNGYLNFCNKKCMTKYIVRHWED